MTLFEALTGGAFDRLTGNIAGNWTKNFQKSQMPGDLPGGGAWAVLELTGTLVRVLYLSPRVLYRTGSRLGLGRDSRV